MSLTQANMNQHESRKFSQPIVVQLGKYDNSLVGLNIRFSYQLESKENKKKLEEYLGALEMFKNNFFFRSQSSFISGVKTICHQYFTIPLPAYKHLMIIVNTLHQILDNSVKIAAENSYSVLSLMIRRISHTSLFTNVTKILKKFSKIKNHSIHFISQCPYLNISPIKLQRHLCVATY